MTDAAVPDNRCLRCGDRGVLVEWDDDLRKYVKRCQLCGHVQGSSVAVQATKGTEGKVDTDGKVETNGKSDGTSWRARIPKATTAAAAAPIVKADGAAAKALESYHVATTRYLEASDQLRVDEQKAAEAQARAKSTAERLVGFRTQMAEARAKLDSELALLTPQGEPKPFRERVKVRAAPTGKLPERPCAGCGKLYRPIRDSHRYCSQDCKLIAYGKKRASEPHPELAEATA